jgi:hypothetical protein
LTADDIGPLLGALPVAAVWLAREWWKTRSSSRSDAVESANAKGQINMLADFERRAKEAEAEADKERAERLVAERKQTKAEGLQADAERDLRAARRDIVSLRRKLIRVGVPDSDMPPLETNFGLLPESKP